MIGWETRATTAGGFVAGRRISCDDFATFLEQRPAERPFYFWFGSQDPHRGYADELRERAFGRGDKFDAYPYHVGYGKEHVEPTESVRNALQLD